MAEKWIFVIVTVTSAFLMMWLIISDVKRARNAAPYGKTFIKKFSEKIEDLFSAQNRAQCLIVFKNGNKFEVRVEEENKQKPLEYRTIPTYKSFLIYINDEPVCRKHVFRINSKELVRFEFSHNRDKYEVIDIIDEAHKCAREIISAYYDKLVERNNKSFYKKEEK